MKELSTAYKSLFLVLCGLLPNLALGQGASLVRATTATVRHTPIAKQSAAETLWQQCDKSFTSKEEASQFFSDRAWEYLAEGNTETAQHRFDAASQLNPKNTEAFWGLGVINFHAGEYENSVIFLEKAYNLEPNNTALAIDFATVQVHCFATHQKCENLENAILLLENATENDPENANGWQKLAWAYFHQNQFDKAWQAVHKGYAQDTSSVDALFINSLQEKLADPMGIFK